ncbi:unnamed protein product, partial [Ascophyllum nodosum]
RLASQVDERLPETKLDMDHLDLRLRRRYYTIIPVIYSSMICTHAKAAPPTPS